MKRAGNLIQKIADTDNVMFAFYKAMKGKRMSREVLLFEKNFEENVLELRNEILSGDVSVGEYEYFYIEDPKLRLICAASFKERVLHHAIMNVSHQYFERNLIETTYATRPEKGVYQAIDRARIAMRQYKYVAKFDFRKYFDSISHRILNKKLARLFKDKTLLGIMAEIIESYSKSEGKGIPIGNLTSQYFANYYISEMDHWIKESLRVPEYIRYMDDFLVFSNDIDEIRRYVKEINDFAIGKLELTLKPVVIVLSDNGIDFLGYRLFPHKVLLTQRSKKRFVKKNNNYTSFLNEGYWSENDYYDHITPLLSYTLKSYSKRLRGKVITA